MTYETDPNRERINDPVLAHHMAHGMKDVMDKAIEAVHTGYYPEAAAGFTVADELGRTAGLTYIADARAALDTHARQLGGSVLHIGEEASHDLEQLAAPFMTAMAEKFPGATFELITDDSGNAWVMQTDGNGTDIVNPNKDYDKARSWDSVMSRKNDTTFTIEVNGQKYDTRLDMTEEAYRAFIEAKKQAGEELPDSQANKLDNGWYTWTLITGEQADGVYAPIARVNDDGSLNRNWTNRDNDNRNLRVRPAVKIV